MAGTDRTKPLDLTVAPAVVLVNPQLGENIGTAARAMANFGLSQLVIVDPRDGWPNERATSAASGASWVIEEASVFDKLAEALSGFQHVYATTARPRGMTKEVITPEQAGADMRRRIAKGEQVAVLFGRERWGLNNDEIALADEIVTAPVHPGFASLNIAQAVLLIGYEWWKRDAQTLGMGTAEAPPISGSGLKFADTRPASKEELFGLFEHLESELEAAGYYKSADMRPTMTRNLRNLFSRAELTEQEVRSLRGVIASLTRAHLKRRGE